MQGGFFSAHLAFICDSEEVEKICSGKPTESGRAKVGRSVRLGAEGFSNFHRNIGKREIHQLPFEYYVLQKIFRT